MSSLRFSAADRRLRLIRTASLIAVATALVAGPAEAQLARIRGGEASLGSAAGARPTGGIVRGVNMRQALAQQQTTQERAAQMRSFVTSARQAAAVSVARANPTNGIGPNGLYPIQAIREAMRLRDAGDQAGAGVILVQTRAANDVGRQPNGTIDPNQAGRNTWDGADLPVQTGEAATPTVTITQTQSRAVLSWERFDVGAGTTVQFNQKQAGVAQRDWVAVNRVTAGTDPTTILGKVNADGQVFVLNRNGVIFGKGAQLNLGSLLASSLELGGYGDPGSFAFGGGRASFRALSLSERNLSFLRNGLLQTARNPNLSTGNGTPPLLLSPQFSEARVEAAFGTPVLLPTAEGDVIVDPGASITTLATGSIILAAPRVDNGGILSASDGQVSLVGGRLITYATLTGEDSSRDPNVRGLFLRALPELPSAPAGPNVPPDPVRDRGAVVNSGLAQSRRGYLSLVTTPTGEIANEGLLEATTSVSRNGKIALYGGRITIGGDANAAQAGGITILPDETGETIPQGSAAEPPRFRRSQIEIGAATSNDPTSGSDANIDLDLDPIGQLLPSIVTFEQNSLLYAPNAQVLIGRRPESGFNALSPSLLPNRIEIADGALLDVSGLKGVALDTTRNALIISPAKRNELRDTPNYREVAVGEAFSLNGKTLTVDIRRSGVRADGVRWIGSPLLEAGSLASQIPVTVAELMTQAGEITLGVNPIAAPQLIRDDPGQAASVSIARGASIDISGGWVSYSGGRVVTTRLRTADGRVVDIGDADPNDRFVSIVDGFTENQPRFGIANRFQNPITEGGRLEGGYDEGSDAGALRIDAPYTRFEGDVRGRAFAGARQAIGGVSPDRTSGIVGDPRRFQSDDAQLPAGGLLQFGTSSENVTQFGANFAIGAAASTADPAFVTRLSGDMLSAAGLSALTIRTSGGVAFEAGSNVELAPGGVLTVDAGRAIRFDGVVRAPSGVISARTTTFGESVAQITSGSRLGEGSIFTRDDDLITLYSELPNQETLGSFDIRVTGTLNAAGLWSNDSRSEDLFQGPGWLTGGTIRLEVAPGVIAALGTSLNEAQDAVDLSGVIDIVGGARLDVSAGGYASIDERLDLSGAAGAIRLINRTQYASATRTARGVVSGEEGDAELPLGGTNQTVGFTPLPEDGVNEAVVPGLVPSQRRAEIRFAGGTLKGLGFSSGGRLELIAPDISFGGDAERRPGATHIAVEATGAIDLAASGFGQLDLTSNRTRFVENLFANGRRNVSAFAETTSFRVRQGQTLNLSQILLPLATDRDDVRALLDLSTGGDVTSVLTPAIPALAFDRKPIDLRLGGLSELVVELGATLTGEPGATISAPKIINFGRIVLPGGTLLQEAGFAGDSGLLTASLGIRSLAELLGQDQGNIETAPNALGLMLDGRVLTNAELFSLDGGDRIVVLLGAGEVTDGIRLAAGSLTDLSGTAILDPRARSIQDSATGQSRQERVGRLVRGGSIVTSSTLLDEGAPTDVAYAARSLIAEPGAIVDISGARATFDEFVPGQGFAAVEQWSDGGRIAALSGGSIAGARINAFGGYGEDEGAFARTGIVDLTRVEARALGGTLEWTRPTLRGDVPSAGAVDVLIDSEIERAGFDTLLARGGLRFGGNVDLTLGKGLLVTAAVTRTGQVRQGQANFITAEVDAIARVAAPYIAFSARPGNAPAYLNLITNDSVAGNAGNITFAAGAQGIDFVGSTLFGPSIGTLGFETPGDIRFIGVDQRDIAGRRQRSNIGSLNGDLLSFADMRFASARSYTTTGTGNLQAFVDAERTTGTAPVPSGSVTYLPFTIIASGDRQISFERTTVNNATPLSAGSYLQVIASRIEQNGYLAAPIGRMEFGRLASGTLFSVPFGVTESVTFGPQSVTSVAGGAAPVPYGTTLDLKEYYFTPATLTPLTGLPRSEMRLNAGAIDVQAGARVDLRGGGDVFAFEFVSGVGGSRDVLDRINTDTFSSNGFDPAAGRGLQFADGRQVFAIVPRPQAQAIADFDPIYSADYGAAGPVDLYGAQAGLSITIDAAGDLPAGEYLLMPAHYALLPGAFRVVENVGDSAPAPGTRRDLLDGSIVVSGQYGFIGTGRQESLRRAFTIQSAETFRRYSRIETSSGTDTIVRQAETAGIDRPRLPIDAGQLVLNRFLSFSVAGLFQTDAANGGRGSQVDIGASEIRIAPAGTAAVEGAVTLIDTSLNSLNAESLFVGGIRIGNADGTTDLRITGRSIDILANARLTAPELLFAVGNEAPDGTIGRSRLVIEDGAIVRATGVVTAGETSDYVIQSFARSGGKVDKGNFFGDGSGSGSTLRVANGPERLVRRTGPGERGARTPATFRIGDAILEGENVVIESTRLPRVLEDVDLRSPNVALIGDEIRFGETITPLLESKLAASARLTLRSPDPIGFNAGTHRFNALVVDAPAIELRGNAPAGANVLLETTSLHVSNSFEEGGRCFVNCGAVDNSLSVTSGVMSFGSGKVRTYGFGGAVTLTARDGMFYEGEGALDVGTARLALVTPFIADRAIEADPREQKLRPDFSFGSRTGITVSNTGAVPAIDAVSGSRVPGAKLTLAGSDAIAPLLTDQERDITVDGALLLATAGSVTLDATRDVILARSAVIATPGFSKQFGDSLDQVTVGASGGTIDLIARTGDVVAGTGSTLISDTGIGEAGAIRVRALSGAIALNGRMNPGLTGTRGGDFLLDAGASAFDLTRFATETGRLFQGTLNIRTGFGDLRLDNGARLRAESVTLTADGGVLTVGGAIDTSGVGVTGLTLSEAGKARVNGGPISLYGRGGVTLTGTALLDTHTTGYADADPRTASAGDIIIGIESEAGRIRIDSGARIDLGARRTEAALAAGQPAARLVAEGAKAPGTLAETVVYRLVEADQGGVLSLRAPVLGANNDRVDISIATPTSISGAREVQVEAFKRYDLDQIDFVGLQQGANGLILDPSENYNLSGLVPGGINYDGNFLSSDFRTEDGFVSIPYFVRNFDVTASDGTALTDFRVRPGVELVTEQGLSLGSQWNLAGADIDYEGAEAAGLVTRIDTLGTRFSSYGLFQAGEGYYSVVPGQEGALLDSDFVDFYYRVGGRARGEAPVVRFRSGGELRVERSINDGFFVFRDRSDQAYINYQLGGGTRNVLPAVQFFCGNVADPTCAQAPRLPDGRYDPNQTGLIRFGDTLASMTAAERNARSVRININLVTAGTALNFGGVPAPLSREANSPAALGTQEDVVGSSGYLGAPLEFGELFPLLPGGAAMRSSDVSLVAGATVDGTYFTNPLQVVFESSANVVVTDAKDVDGQLVRGAYQIRASGRATQQLQLDGLQLRFFREAEGVPLILGLDNFFGQELPDTDFSFDELAADTFGVLNWGNPSQSEAAADAAAEASEFFEGRTFLGTRLNRSGVIAPFAEILSFLEGYQDTLLANIGDGLVNTNLGAAPDVTRFASGARAQVQTFVRTGDGRISVAAGQDVDLRDAENAIFRFGDGTITTRNNSNGRQIGGTSIYTAGQRLAPTPISARLPEGGIVSVSPTSGFFVPDPENVNNYLTPQTRSDAEAVIAHNGGDVSVVAGRDILGRRDLWSEEYRVGPRADEVVTAEDIGIVNTVRLSGIGNDTQAWRVGQVGSNTEAAIAPQYFAAGIGALAGGDVRIEAVRDISDITVALNSALSSEVTGTTPVLITWGRGNLTLGAGRDVIAGRFDLSSGQADVWAGRDFAPLVRAVSTTVTTETPLFRLENATVRVRAGRTIAANAGSLGVSLSTNERLLSAGLYSAITGFDAIALGDIRFGGGTFATPSLALGSLTGSIAFDQSTTLYPSPIGQLSLLAAGDLSGVSLAMLDIDPTLLDESAFASGLGLRPDRDLAAGFPGINGLVDENTRRLYHNSRITHAGDREPVRIHVDGSIADTSLNMPKAARITAGEDIVDMYFVGQNLDPQDETRISAGRDITATSQAGTTFQVDAKPYFGANGFYLGGPGTFSIEAGRNLGPFITSSLLPAPGGGTYAAGGGIITVGNEYNPWLGEQGADLNIQFGTSNGMDLEGLRDTYLKPENLVRLDGDLFEQFTDTFGNERPDRTKPIYAPVLARWLRDNEPAVFTQVFGARTFGSDAELDNAAYSATGALYDGLASLPLSRQKRFLVNELYFRELEEPSNPNGPSSLQYVRGYRAVEALFPTRLGYTDNLAAYDTDPATVDEDNPQGVPTRRLGADGQPLPAERVLTGSADLRLATFQTARGGDITILAPGGDMLAGSVVRTAEQVNRRNTRFLAPNVALQTQDPSLRNIRYGSAIEFGGRGQINRGAQLASPIAGIPLGLEGILSLRSGAIRSFTDGDLRLNQSRLFSNGGGDITAWSSNGDLNAGQGPKSAANFPPITVRFSPNAFGRVDTGAGISGAGIGSFKVRPDDPAATIRLIAPVGEVDAGDAGVRASGDILVAAARVANADNFRASGTISGVPSNAPSAAPPPPSSAASQVAAQVARIADSNRPDDRRSVIIVDVLGFSGGDRCRDPNNEDPNCPK